MYQWYIIFIQLQNYSPYGHTNVVLFLNKFILLCYGLLQILTDTESNLNFQTTIWSGTKEAQSV